jgi:hypothetical protein
LEVLFLGEVFEIYFQLMLFGLFFASVAFFLCFEANFTARGLRIDLRGVLVEKTGSWFEFLRELVGRGYLKRRTGSERVILNRSLLAFVSVHLSVKRRRILIFKFGRLILAKLILREFVDKVWGVDEVKLFGVLIGEDVLEIGQRSVVWTTRIFVTEMILHFVKKAVWNEKGKKFDIEYLDKGWDIKYNIN